MMINGIGHLVSQLVHDRNAARFADKSNASSKAHEAHQSKAAKTSFDKDTVELSEAAMARFEALKARMVGGEPELTSIKPEPLPQPIGIVDSEGEDSGSAGGSSLDDGTSKSPLRLDF